MIYKRFNREKWDKDVEEWRMKPNGERFLSPRDRSFIEYWDIECEFESHEMVGELLKIEGDYLFPDIDGWCYYSIKDCKEWDQVRGEKFPVKWEWFIRDLRIDSLIY